MLELSHLNWVPNLEIASIWVGYIAILFALRILVPGKNVMGEPLPPDYKKRLPYTMNGFRIVVIFLAAMAMLWKTGCINPSYIMRNIPALFVVANIWAFSGIFIHFAWGLTKPDHERHGNILLDLWYGIDLNPRILGIDLKVFAYLPSMLLWLVFNLFALLAHYDRFGTVHTGMIMYQVFTGIYVLDYFWFEEAILSIYDVIEERFGFMLIVRVCCPFSLCVLM
jgi:delta14-sterol reductase